MKRQLAKVYPLLVILLVAAVLGAVHWWDTEQPQKPSPFQRFEWYLQDWRARLALRTPVPSAATNLAVVMINDQATEVMAAKFPALGGRWPFHHFHYGPVLDELKAQGARAVGFDIMFVEPDDRISYRVPQLTGSSNAVGTTEFFANRLRASGNAILAAASQGQRVAVTPPLPQLHTNALALGLVNAANDGDGVMRRVIAFRDDPKLGRVWCLGFVMAAQELGADLRQAIVEPGRIKLTCADGKVREVPLDRANAFPIDWVVRAEPDVPAAQRLRMMNFAQVFTAGWNRAASGKTNDLGLRDHLVLIAAGGSGINSVDQAPSSIQPRDSIALAHLNVANSLLSGRFVQRPAVSQEIAILLALIVVSTIASWRLSTGRASLVVLGTAGLYVAFAVWVYLTHRWLLPIAQPVVGAILTTHLVMIACRTAENAEKRHLRRMLEKVVSPKVINDLLASDSPTPHTRRMNITVLFADLRGFTRYSEESQTHAETAARALGMPAEEARKFADEAAREAMDSVNRYLAAVVDEVKASDGTLDKYMGDCVMAFWGAPVPDEEHAAKAIRCAIASEQALERIHREIIKDNQRREQENRVREADRKPALPLLPVLRMGIGLNSGLATVGFMGSERHLSSYTAFGHVVNVASRVEGLAAGGLIVATEATVLAAGRNHPDLINRCKERPPMLLKGISTDVKTYEVDWKAAVAPTTEPKAA